jgi:hypothetical protein
VRIASEFAKANGLRHGDPPGLPRSRLPRSPHIQRNPIRPARSASDPTPESRPHTTTGRAFRTLRAFCPRRPSYHGLSPQRPPDGPGSPRCRRLAKAGAPRSCGNPGSKSCRLHENFSNQAPSTTSSTRLPIRIAILILSSEEQARWAGMQKRRGGGQARPPISRVLLKLEAQGLREAHLPHCPRLNAPLLSATPNGDGGRDASRSAPARPRPPWIRRP